MSAGRAQALAALAVSGVETGAFRQMLDALPVAAYATDAQGRLTYFNPAAVKFAGHTPELGTDRWCVVWKLFLADGTPLPHEESPIAALLRGEAPQPDLELIAQRPDGTRSWFTPHPAILRDSQEGISGAVNLLVDVTERKATELEADEQFRAMVETTPECVKIVAPDGTLLFLNPSGLRMVGASLPSEAIGKSIYGFIAPEDRERYRRFNERVCQGERGSLEYDMVGAAGERRRMESHAGPLRRGGGAAVHLSVTHDVTDRKRAVAALVASEARLEQLADSMPQIVWSARPDGYVDYYNARWYDFSGSPAGTLGDAGWASLLHPDDLPGCREAWEAAQRQGQPYNRESRLWDRRERRWRWFILRALPIRDAAGNVEKWFGTATDIDEQKRVEADLRGANEDLEQFAFSAGHDLQEPLRGVRIYSELLAVRCGDVLNSDARKYLHWVRAGAARMETMLHDLLAYTRITRLTEPVQTADANEALATALSNLASVVSDCGAQIEAGPLPSLPAHAAHLQQLFQNLVGNAVKYRSPDRPLAIRITCELRGQECVFAVKDNGIGIAAEYQEAIFGLFARLHAADEFSGTGIGLAICKRIVERYRGRIWVESQPGTGSAFFFALPA